MMPFFSNKIREFYFRANNLRGSFLHYLGMAKKNNARYLSVDKVKYKKYFYSLRPLFACNWIIKYKSLPPLNFSKLLSSCEIENKLLFEIEELLRKKRKGEEALEGERIRLLHNYIETETERLLPMADNIKLPQNSENFCKEIDDHFREIVLIGNIKMQK